MGVEISSDPASTTSVAPKSVGAPIHRILRRNASEADLATARTSIGHTFTDTPSRGTAAFAEARLQIVDVYLDDLRRLMAVVQIVGTW